MSKKQMVALKMDFTHNLLCGEYRPHKTTTTVKANEPRKAKLLTFKGRRRECQKQSRNKNTKKKETNTN